MFAPMNSMNLPSCQSPESNGLSQSKKNADKKPKMGRDHREFLNAQHERIETQESISKDPTISPKTKALRKLTRHISDTIAQKGAVP